ncbi:MAG: hypothetical protein QM680_07230 [Luteolibacter sp.]
MEYSATTENNIVSTDPVIRDDQTLIYLGTPSHTTTPYDFYARMLVKEARIAFARVGIPAEIVSCPRRIASVGYGSGPGGAVRFGDDMLPPDVQAIVPQEYEEGARQAWEDHRARKYLPRPYSVIGDRWFDTRATRSGPEPWFGNSGAWVRGGAWNRTIHNAISIAKALGRDTGKLEAYLVRHAA